MELAPLAEPPGDFAWTLPTVEEDRLWFRVHACTQHAVHFNRAVQYRFNAPAGEFGVLYAAEAIEAAFSESLVRLGKRPPKVEQDMLAQRRLSALRWSRPLRVVDFAGAGLVRLGIDARLCSGDNYALCRRWALWVHNHPASADGILYRARTAPHRRSIALFERAGSPDTCELVTPSLASPSFSEQLGELLATFGVELI